MKWNTVFVLAGLILLFHTESHLQREMIVVVLLFSGKNYTQISHRLFKFNVIFNMM